MMLYLYLFCVSDDELVTTILIINDLHLQSIII